MLCLFGYDLFSYWGFNILPKKELHRSLQKPCYGLSWGLKKESEGGLRRLPGCLRDLVGLVMGLIGLVMGFRWDTEGGLRRLRRLHTYLDWLLFSSLGHEHPGIRWLFSSIRGPVRGCRVIKARLFKVYIKAPELTHLYLDPKKYVKSWPVWLLFQVKGHYFTYWWFAGTHVTMCRYDLVDMSCV